MIETFDANHCPNTKQDSSTNSMEINSSQYIQNEKRLNNEALVGFYKYHRGISWVPKPFLDNYYYNNPPTRTPGILIWCFATWITWIPKISTCHQSLCIPVIFTNIMCDLYTLNYEQVKQHFGYMVYSRDDYLRFKRIYTNSANLRSQVITLYQDTHVCDNLRQKTAYDNLSTSVNDDIRYFVDRCFYINGDNITNNGRCRITPNRVVLDYSLYVPQPPLPTPPLRRRRRRRRGRRGWFW